MESEGTLTLMEIPRTEIDDLLPEEIQEILSRLPIVSLFQSRYVCPFWRFLINERNFSIMHYKQSSKHPNPTSLFLHSYMGFNPYYIPDTDTFEKAIKLTNFPFLDWFIELVGSVNGILCFAKIVGRYLSFIICNPVIGDWFETPDPFDLVHPVDSILNRSIFYGFGYDPNSERYTVMRIIKAKDDPIKAAILTLGKRNSWRSIGTVPNDVFWRFPGFYFSGRLHWLVYNDRHMVVGIKAFNIEKETFGIISVPDSLFGKVNAATVHLGVLGGCFMIADTFKKKLEVWIMKEYGVKESWVREFVIPRPKKRGTKRPVFQPLMLLKNGNVLISSYGGASGPFQTLYSYDPKTKKIKDLKVIGLPSHFIAVTHVATPVMLKDVIPMEGL